MRKQRPAALRKPVRKKTEVLDCYLTVAQRRRIEKEARKRGLTMSWIVRSILRGYRSRFPEPPSINESQTADRVRFSLCFYGDKADHLAWARHHGADLGPTIRFALDLWMRGDLKVLFDVNSVKFSDFRKRTLAKHKFRGTGYVSTYRIKGQLYKQSDFYPINKKRNLAQMLRGLRNRIHPLPG